MIITEAFYIRDGINNNEIVHNRNIDLTAS